MTSPEGGTGAGVRPVPSPTLDSEPFWQAAQAHELLIQWCDQCGRLSYPPAPRCRGCLRELVSWRRLSGSARLHGWAVVHPQLVPGIVAPYVTGEVELAEQAGLLMPTAIIGSAPGRLRLGMPMRVCWLDIGEGWTIPAFAPDENGGPGSGAAG